MIVLIINQPVQWTALQLSGLVQVYWQYYKLTCLVDSFVTARLTTGILVTLLANLFSGQHCSCQVDYRYTGNTISFTVQWTSLYLPGCLQVYWQHYQLTCLVDCFVAARFTTGILAITLDSRSAEHSARVNPKMFNHPDLI